MDRKTLGSTEQFGTNSKFFERKNPCNLAFQNKLFAFISDPAGYSVFSNAWNCVCSIGLFAVPSDQEVKRNAGNDRDGNEQRYFKPIYISKLLRQAVICKINTDLLDEKRRLSAV